MAQSHLPPPVLTSYQLDEATRTPVEEPIQMPVEKPVPMPVEEPIQMPVEETIRRVPVEKPVPMPIKEPIPMPVEESLRRVPVEDPPLRRIPVEEPPLVKEEQIMQRNQIMQNPSGFKDWLSTEDVIPQQMPEPHRHSPIPVRKTSTYSARIKDNDSVDTTIANTATPRRAISAGSRKSVPTTAEARPMPGSAFLGGAGAIGPKATAKEDILMTARNEEAQASLTPKQKSKIAKIEAKHDKRLSKIIKEEGKAEKNALANAIDELDNLQKIQKGTIKNETQVQANLVRLNVALKKAETDFLNAKNRCDTAQGAVNAGVKNLETVRTSARDATKHLQKKSAEVNTLRFTLGVDEREREVKLTQLQGERARSPSFWS